MTRIITKNASELETSGGWYELPCGAHVFMGSRGPVEIDDGNGRVSLCEADDAKPGVVPSSVLLKELFQRGWRVVLDPPVLAHSPRPVTGRSGAFALVVDALDVRKTKSEEERIRKALENGRPTEPGLPAPPATEPRGLHDAIDDAKRAEHR